MTSSLNTTLLHYSYLQPPSMFKVIVNVLIRNGQSNILAPGSLAEEMIVLLHQRSEGGSARGNPLTKQWRMRYDTI